MVEIKRSNPKCFEILADKLKAMDGKVGKAGWLPGSVYENGKPVAYIAAVHEFGARISHPGGTPYRIGEGGQAMFVTKAEGAGLPVTKPHQIIIPPRPMLRPTIEREKDKWFKLIDAGVKKVLEGGADATKIFQAVVQQAAADIQKTIIDLRSPPLKPSTIAARRRGKSNKKMVGSLDKPLVAEGILLNSVTGAIEDE